MSEFRSILPGNSTDLEKHLERTVDFGKFEAPLDLLGRAKLDAIDSYVPFLIWEYGLGELLPYLKDPKRALSEGILWQRLRGTPQSLVIALEWIDFEAVIEQEETGMKFAEFMLDTGKVIRDPSIIPDVLALADLSSPARSRLSRIYNGYDIRRLKLSEGPKGELNHHMLSDYSGVHSDGIRISFGETFKGHVVLANPDVVLRTFTEHVDFQRVYVDDVFRSSVGWLDDSRHARNPFIYHSHLFSFGNSNYIPVDQEDLEARKFQRAQIVLSDSWEDSGGLSDHNGVLAPAWYDVFEGDETVLSDRVELSNQKNTFHRITVLERDYTVHPGATTYSFEATVGGTLQNVHTAFAEIEKDDLSAELRLSEGMIDLPVPVSLTQSLMVITNVHYRLWEGTWDDGTWDKTDLMVPGSVQVEQVIEPRRFCKAMLVMSDGATLSDPNGVLNAFVEVEVDGELVRQEVLERTVNEHALEGAYSDETYDRGVIKSGLHVSHVRLGYVGPSRLSEDRRDYGPLRPINPSMWEWPFDEVYDDQTAFRTGLSTSGAVFKGQYWVDTKWPPDTTWAGINVVISGTHATETME